MAANPLKIIEVYLAENDKVYYSPGFNGTNYPPPTGNCTFTLEDGSQFTTAGSQEVIEQAVTSISCVPIDGFSSEEITTALSVASGFSTTSPYSTTSSIPALSVAPLSPTTYSISAVSAIPPYPTESANSSAAGGTRAVSSTVLASSTAVMPEGSAGLVPFTGDASSLRSLYSVPTLSLLVGFWFLR